MNVALFTPELPITEDIPHYSGGLGILFFKCFEAARDAGLDLTLITLLYRYGYYRQNASYGGMTISYEPYRDDVLIEQGLRKKGTIAIPFGGKNAYLNIWEQPAVIAGNAQALFLDADIPENDELTRRNTLFLYGGSSVGYTIETRIAQSVLLARGGLCALKHLKIKPDVFHVNESHSAFVGMERLVALIEKGKNFPDALTMVRRDTLFTTHTPRRAGNPVYSVAQIEKIAGYRSAILSRLPLAWGVNIDMAAIGYFLSGITNAVSAKHYRIAKDLLAWIPEKRPISFVTNGQNDQFWQHNNFRHVASIEDMRGKKKIHKHILIDHVRKKVKKEFHPDILTIVVAGRFDEYKRKGLITSDRNWLDQQLTGNHLQIIISGKPHPDDQKRIDEWNELYRLSQRYNNLAVIHGHEIPDMKIYKRGADVWVNTPRAPYEACGTAGMGAAYNGTINVSTSDGWYEETESDAFFLFGSNGVQDADQDAFDQKELIKCVRNVADLYYKNPEQFYQKAFEAKQIVERRFTTKRMMRDYAILYKHVSREHD